MLNNVLCVYFSGTDNTKYVAQRFSDNFNEKGTASEIHSIEENVDFGSLIKSHDTVLIAYPIYGSMLPRIMQRFLIENRAAFCGKNLITVISQCVFSGDGGAPGARLLKNVRHIASVHINMPSNISDKDIIKIKSDAENGRKICAANAKIDNACVKILNGKRLAEGRIFFVSRAMGFICQRMYFKIIAKKLKNAIKIDDSRCIRCGRCVELCPMKNLTMDNGVKQKGDCTLCYRCVNSCPNRCISLMSEKKPTKQYKIKNV